jgi:hypothetical protein
MERSVTAVLGGVPIVRLTATASQQFTMLPVMCLPSRRANTVPLCSWLMCRCRDAEWYTTNRTNSSKLNSKVKALRPAGGALHMSCYEIRHSDRSNAVMACRSATGNDMDKPCRYCGCCTATVLGKRIASAGMKMAMQADNVVTSPVHCVRITVFEWTRIQCDRPHDCITATTALRTSSCWRPQADRANHHLLV